MALYQPSNIIPSQLSGFGSGVIHSADNINISWQVNGTSGMTGYDILIFNADYANNNTSQVGETHTYSLSTPFYGTDPKGNTVFYVFPNTNSEKWSDWGLTDGNAYTMQINQKYNDGQSTRTVTQYSQSFFITRTTPTLALQNFSNAISKVECAFNAVYTQAQGDTINWARWQFALVNGTTYTLLDDTGTIDTGVLSYSQEGLLSGNTYAVNCIVQTQNGELVETGWKNFDVVYASGTTSNNFSLEQKTNFNLLKWGDYQRNILGRAVGAYTISNGKIQLNAGSYVEWDTVDDNPMSFAPPFNIAFSATKTGNLYNQFVLGNIHYSSCAFSPINNNLLVLGSFYGSSVSAVVLGNNGVQQNITITKNGEDLSNIREIAFSPNGELLVVVGNNGASVFSVNNLTFAYLYDLQLPNGTLPVLYTVTFNDAGTALFLGGGDTSVGNGGYIFTVSNTQITYSQTIFTPDRQINSAAFVDNDSTLIVGGNFDARCVSFSIANGVYTNKGALPVENGTPISLAVNKISACKAKNIFVVATEHQAYWYTITNGVIEYKGVVPRSYTEVINISQAVAFNHLGDTLVMYGGFSGIGGTDVACYMKIYQVTDTDIVYNQSKVFSVNPVGEVDSLLDCAFSADDVALAVLTNSTVNSFCYYTLNSQNSFVQFNSNDVTLKAGKLSVIANNEIIGEVPIPYYLILQNKLDFIANIFADSVFVKIDNIEKKVNYSVPIADSQISNIRLYGDLTCDWLSIEKSVDSNIITAQPTWNVNTYMLATFTQNLQAGLQVSEYRCDIYRLNTSTGITTKIYSAPQDTTMLRDFKNQSLTNYTYQLFAVVGERYAAVEEIANICYRLNSYYLYEATQDEIYPNVYHVLRYWRFGNNISAGTVTNNNSPSFQLNFTRYRTKQPTTLCAKSGTLQALLSNVSNGAYNDTATQMEELFKASLSKNTFFIKDMKGNLYMVAISKPISQTINTKASVQQVTISLSWEEIGDATDVSLIQLPTDANWDSTN